MKYLGKSVIVAVSAAALTASVGAISASATELTCGVVHHTLCSTAQTVHTVSIGKIVVDAPFGNVECESTIHGFTTNPGSKSTTAGVTVSKGGATLTNCGGDTVTVLAEGSLEIHTDTENVNDGNGRVTSTGTRITVVHLGVHCIFETNSTDVGTILGSTSTGHHAIFQLKGTIPRIGGGGGVFCGSSAPWTGNYTVTTPTTLVVD
jgi:hypothetical protein